MDFRAFSLYVKKFLFFAGKIWYDLIYIIPEFYGFLMSLNISYESLKQLKTQQKRERKI